MANMVPRDQMLILLGKLSCTINVSPMTCSTRQAPGSEKVRERVRTAYMIEGKSVCRETFMYLHAISRDRLTALLKWYRNNGLAPKEKRSGGRSNQKRAYGFDDIKRSVAFITNYAEDHALVLPGRVPGFNNHDVKLLPSCETKVKVYQAYCVAMSQINVRCMSESQFRDTWIKLTPFIVTARPMTDLCWTCQRNNILIYRGTNIPEEEKSSRLRQQEQHLLIVHRERSVYNSMVQNSRQTCKDNQLVQFHTSAPCSRPISMHYSFDFAQQVHLPSDPLQPGPIYFLVPRKVGLFGVCCEGIPKQVNYIIDEAHLISKGSNAVVSYLHHFFESFGLGETDVQLHCDNCSGQNKNRFVLWYCAWRVCVGLHQSISLNFMITGHTKFAPDGCFGLLKRAFKRHAVSSLEEFEKVVNESACVNQAQLIGKEDGSSFVSVCEWQQHLNPHFRPFPGIKKYQHFRFDATHPGKVFAKLSTESEEVEFNMLKGPISNLPRQGAQQIIPPGLPLQRQWYLFNQIREFVKDHLQDVVCPRPAEAAPPVEEMESDYYENHLAASKTVSVKSCGRGREGKGRVARCPGKRSRSSSISEKTVHVEHKQDKQTKGKGRSRATKK